MSKQIKKCAYYDYMLCKTFLHTLVFEDASSPLFLTYCRIDIFRVLRQSFCGKFQIVCGFWNPANPVFRMYGHTPLTLISFSPQLYFYHLGQSLPLPLLSSPGLAVNENDDIDNCPLKVGKYEFPVTICTWLAGLLLQDVTELED